MKGRQVSCESLGSYPPCLLAVRFVMLFRGKGSGDGLID
jgi:hypothetical protein